MFTDDKYIVNVLRDEENKLCIESMKGKEIKSKFKGIKTYHELYLSKFMYGNANIIIPEKNVFVLFIDEVLTPFNMFQVFSVVLWFSDG